MQDHPHITGIRYLTIESDIAIKLIFTTLQTAPFLIRTFVKIGGFHRLTLFEDGTLPTTDEQQIFTWFVSFYYNISVKTVRLANQS